MHDLLADETLALVKRWLRAAQAQETAAERALVAPLRGMIEDPEGVDFTMRFVDRVARPDDPTGEPPTSLPRWCRPTNCRHSSQESTRYSSELGRLWASCFPVS